MFNKKTLGASCEFPKETVLFI